MTELTTDRLLPALTDEPDDVADAVDRLARIRAITDWLDGRSNAIRDWLGAKADEVEGMTGGAFNVPVQGVGRAIRTDPSPRIVITDDEAFRSWWCGEHPNQCQTVLRVEVRDEMDRETLDWAASIIDDPTGYEHDDWLACLRDLYHSLTVTTDVAVPEDVTDQMTVTADGRVVDADGQLVDGVEVRQSSRQLRVTPDRDYLDRLTAQLQHMLQPADTTT